MCVCVQEGHRGEGRRDMTEDLLGIIIMGLLLLTTVGAMDLRRRVAMARHRRVIRMPSPTDTLLHIMDTHRSVPSSMLLCGLFHSCCVPCFISSLLTSQVSEHLKSPHIRTSLIRPLFHLLCPQSLISSISYVLNPSLSSALCIQHMYASSTHLHASVCVCADVRQRVSVPTCVRECLCPCASGRGYQGSGKAGMFWQVTAEGRLRNEVARVLTLEIYVKQHAPPPGGDPYAHPPHPGWGHQGYPPAPHDGHYPQHPPAHEEQQQQQQHQQQHHPVCNQKKS